ncbi:uncharacterized protein C05D11.1-like [Babylonia areolata]|uniref:uncharacterized protein C05D11.1-like n=1 Tax=Babylonia areolata TaxID=304850 RepID=UPI003FD6715F
MLVRALRACCRYPVSWKLKLERTRTVTHASHSTLSFLSLNMASSTDSFQLLYDVVSNGKIPVRMYKSKDTHMSVAIAQVEGPLVNGYFCLATEAHDDDGLPHTLEHLVFLGSEDYPYKGVLDLLANRCLASGTNAWTDTDHTCYTMTTAGSEGFLQLLPIYVDHILHPTLKESGFVTEVHHINGEGEDAGVVYCEMQGRENKGESLTHLAMLRAMYPGHCGYRSETGGIMANLRDSTTHTKVCKYHQDFYRPENLCLIITGDVQPHDVFRALKPVEEKIKKKGLQGPFRRPWQSAVPLLAESVEQVISYPTDDEEYGMVTVAWRGPQAKDQYTFEALNILLDYLSETAISPLQRDFVEIEEPYCSQVCQFVIENSVCCFGFNFQNVDSKFLKEISPKLDQVLSGIAEGGETLDMQRMGNILHRRVLDALNSLEDDNHDAVACMIIGQFLYGDTQDDFEVRLNTISSRQRLKQEGEAFWLDMLKRFTQGVPKVVVVGEPSQTVMEQKGQEEKQRIAAQRQRLGTEGLEKCRVSLEEATAANEVEPPESILTSVDVPGTDSIHFHHLTPYSNPPAPGRAPTENPLFPLKDLPCRFQLDDLTTNFARMMVLIDTSSIPLALKYYLPLFTEALMESPILRDGEVIPHERVIAELEKDTQSTDTGLGLPPGCFQCGHFPQFLVVEVKVEEEKYERGVQWLRDVLHGTQFTAERLKIIANRKIGDISSLKRSGSRIVRTLLQDMVFSKESTYNVSSMLRQSTFLTQLLEKLETSPEQVESDLNQVRDQLLQPQNVRVHVSCDVSKLSKTCAPAIPWKAFLSGSTQQCGDGDAVPKMAHYILPLESSPHQKVIVGVGDVESAFFLQVVPSVSSYHDAELPALMVLIQYLIQCEGPMWCQIRGLGLAYGYSINIRPDLGLLYLMLTKSAQVVEAYQVGSKIVQEYLSGETEFSEVELESARSSLIFEIIEEDKTVWDAAEGSVLSYFRGVGPDYNRHMVKQVSQVTISDLKVVGQKYLSPLFSVDGTRCVACVHPSKVQEVADGFGSLGVKLTTIPSLDEQFLTSL